MHPLINRWYGPIMEGVRCIAYLIMDFSNNKNEWKQNYGKMHNFTSKESNCTSYSYICYWKKRNTFSVLIYSYINTSKIGKTRNCVGNFFTKFRVLPISTSVDITVYLYGKMFFIFFMI